MVTRRKVVSSLTKLLLSALLTIFAFILMMQGFGWFSTKRIASASGQNLQMMESGYLEIRADADGEDIGVTVAEKTMEKLPMDGELSMLRPGISGSFSFYVYDNSAGVPESYSFMYGVSVENNQFHEGEDYPEGFYPNTNEEERAEAKEYVNAHLLFFTDMENGVYSGWISPGCSTRRTVKPSDGSTPHKETVYWVWINWYHQIFEENDLIEEKTRKEIVKYFSEEGNLNKMFADGTESVEAYNLADTLIGVTFKYICFQIDVYKE